MHALRKSSAAPGLDFCEVPDPDPAGSGDVIISVAAAGICGTDLHIADWTGEYNSMINSMPVTLGHEFAGNVVSTSSGAVGVAAGARVVVRPSVTCGQCAACRAGMPTDCSGRRGIGIHRDGAFAPYVRVPAANCIALPSHMDFEVAALAEPFTVCAQAIDRSRLRPGARVLVLGPGPIGQGIAVLAAAADAGEVVAVGRHDAARLAVLSQIVNATVIDCGDDGLGDALRRSGQDPPFDIIFEATGHAGLVSDALAVLKDRGNLVVCGIHPRPANLDLTRLVRREQTLTGTYRAPPETWTKVMAFLATQGDRVRPIITHRLPLTDIMRGFDLARRRSASKVMIFPSAN